MRGNGLCFAAALCFSIAGAAYAQERASSPDVESSQGTPESPGISGDDPVSQLCRELNGSREFVVDECVRKTLAQGPNAEADAAERLRQRHQFQAQQVLPSGNRSASRGTVPAITRGLSVVPGAIVCPDYNTTSLMFDLYVHAWEDQMQDQFTHGQAELIRGKAASLPHLAAYRCSMIPPGTQVEVETGNSVPVIDMRAGNALLRVVTLPGMLTAAPGAPEWFKAGARQ